MGVSFRIFPVYLHISVCGNEDRWIILSDAVGETRMHVVVHVAVPGSLEATPPTGGGEGQGISPP